MKRGYLLGFGFLALIACSSKGTDPEPSSTPSPTPNLPNNPETPTMEAGIENPPENPTPPSNPPVQDAGKGVSTDAPKPETQASCLAKCRTQFPLGAAKADAVDACWAKNCNPACTSGDPDGKNYPPATGKDCQYPVLTPFQTCSNCTAEKCCTEWDGLFLNPEGQKLNQCSLECWKLPQ